MLPVNKCVPVVLSAAELDEQIPNVQDEMNELVEWKPTSISVRFAALNPDAWTNPTHTHVHYNQSKLFCFVACLVSWRRKTGNLFFVFLFCTS